ncbi:hypothetical protein Tco_0172403, partial [Tanacetum coccineum]
LLTNCRLLKELVAPEKANKLDTERKKDVEVKVASASLLQKKQELAVTHIKAYTSLENQAKKAFAMSKGKFTYPSLAARSLVRNTGLDHFLDCLSRYFYNILKRYYVGDDDAKLLSRFFLSYAIQRKLID